jgi:hypothetical protein
MEPSRYASSVAEPGEVDDDVEGETLEGPVYRTSPIERFWAWGSKGLRSYRADRPLDLPMIAAVFLVASVVVGTVGRAVRLSGVFGWSINGYVIALDVVRSADVVMLAGAFVLVWAGRSKKWRRIVRAAGALTLGIEAIAIAVGVAGGFAVSWAYNDDALWESRTPAYGFWILLGSIALIHAAAMIAAVWTFRFTARSRRANGGEA